MKTNIADFFKEIDKRERVGALLLLYTIEGFYAALYTRTPGVHNLSTLRCDAAKQPKHEMGGGANTQSRLRKKKGLIMVHGGGISSCLLLVCAQRIYILPAVCRPSLCF